MSKETKIIVAVFIVAVMGGIVAGAITNTVLYLTAGSYINAAYDQALNLFNSARIRCSTEHIEGAMMVEIDGQAHYCLAYEIERELGKEYSAQAPRGDINNMLPN